MVGWWGFVLRLRSCRLIRGIELVSVMVGLCVGACGMEMLSLSRSGMEIRCWGKACFGVWLWLCDGRGGLVITILLRSQWMSF